MNPELVEGVALRWPFWKREIELIAQLIGESPASSPPIYVVSAYLNEAAAALMDMASIDEYVGAEVDGLEHGQKFNVMLAEIMHGLRPALSSAGRHTAHKFDHQRNGLPWFSFVQRLESIHPKKPIIVIRDPASMQLKCAQSILSGLSQLDEIAGVQGLRVRPAVLFVANQEPSEMPWDAAIGHRLIHICLPRPQVDELVAWIMTDPRLADHDRTSTTAATEMIVERLWRGPAAPQQMRELVVALVEANLPASEIIDYLTQAPAASLLQLHPSDWASLKESQEEGSLDTGPANGDTTLFEDSTIQHVVLLATWVASRRSDLLASKRSGKQSNRDVAYHSVSLKKIIKTAEMLTHPDKPPRHALLCGLQNLIDIKILEAHVSSRGDLAVNKAMGWNSDWIENIKFYCLIDDASARRVAIYLNLETEDMLGY